MKRTIFFTILFLIAFTLTIVAFYYKIPYRSLYFFIFYFLFIYLTSFYDFHQIKLLLGVSCFFHLMTVIYFERLYLNNIIYWLFQYAVLGYFIYFFNRYHQFQKERLSLSFRLNLLEKMNREYLKSLPVDVALKTIADLTRDVLPDISGIYFNLRVQGKDYFIFEYRDFPDTPKEERLFYNEIVEFLDNLPQKEEVMVMEKVEEKYPNLYRAQTIVYFPVYLSESERSGEVLVFSRKEFSYQEIELLNEFFEEIFYLLGNSVSNVE